MSPRDTIPAFAVCAVAAALLMLFLSGARAEETGAAPVPPAPPASPDACRQADQEGVPPPPGADCTEYQVRLEQQAKRMESQAKVMEQHAKRLELLAKIKSAREPTGQSDNPPPAAAAQPRPEDADRVLEVFGDRASIRYHGGEILVRQGEGLPQGGRVERVSLDGVVVSDGRGRHTLPFFIGGRR